MFKSIVQRRSAVAFKFTLRERIVGDMLLKSVYLAAILALLSCTLVAAKPVLVNISIKPKPDPGARVFFYFFSEKGSRVLIETTTGDVSVALPLTGGYFIIAGFIRDNDIFLGYTDLKILSNTSVTINVTNINSYPKKLVKIEVLDTQGRKINSCLIAVKILNKTIAFGITLKGELLLEVPNLPYLNIEVYSLNSTPMPQQSHRLKAATTGALAHKSITITRSVPNKLTIVLERISPISLQKTTAVEGGKRAFGAPEKYTKITIILLLSFLSAALLYLIARRKI